MTKPPVGFHELSPLQDRGFIYDKHVTRACRVKIKVVPRNLRPLQTGNFPVCKGRFFVDGNGEKRKIGEVNSL